MKRCQGSVKLMKKAILFALLSPLICGACAKGAAPTPQGDNDLLTSLISALNTKDKEKLKGFIEAHFSKATPVETRLARIGGLMDQGAPFAITRKLHGDPGTLSAIVSDKSGMTLNFRVKLSAADPSKIDGVMIAPVDDIDAPPPKDYTGWKDLDSLAESIRIDTKNPAAGIAMIHDGKLEVAVAGTRTDGGQEKVGANEPWSIGSIGKPICSTIIGKLIEMGKLDWSTTLGQALPDMPMKDGYKNTTIEQIMHHRGGIPADPGMRKPDADRIIAGATDPAKMRENYAKDILQREPIAKAGERFEYSNAGFALLGVIAERVSHKSYEQLVKDLVFAPLGLKNSYTGADTLPAARPKGHLRGPNGLQPANFMGPLEVLFAPAGGGMFMSLADIAKFGEAHMKGLQGKDGLLKAETMKRLHQGIPEADPQGRQYACGWGIEAFPSIETMHMHNGSNGTMRAQLSIFPNSNLVVASFVNAGGESEPSPPLQAVLAVAGRYAKAKS